MSKDEIITATEASREFSDVLHRVCYSGESFIIKKGNRMMARIVPVDESEVVAAKSAKAKKAAKVETSAEMETVATPSQINKPREIVAPPVPAPVADTPFSQPDYYKTVLAEMDKLLAE